MDSHSPPIPKLKLSNDVERFEPGFNPLKTVSTVANSGFRKDSFFGNEAGKAART